MSKDHRFDSCSQFSRLTRAAILARRFSRSSNPQTVRHIMCAAHILDSHQCGTHRRRHLEEATRVNLGQTAQSLATHEPSAEKIARMSHTSRPPMTRHRAGCVWRRVVPPLRRHAGSLRSSAAPFARRRLLVAVCSSPFARRRLLVAVCLSPFARRRLLVAVCSSPFARRRPKQRGLSRGLGAVRASRTCVHSNRKGCRRLSTHQGARLARRAHVSPAPVALSREERLLQRLRPHPHPCSAESSSRG
jgi:hypothetical protein